MKYATEIDKLDSISSNVNFKILLISSSINSDAQYRINGNRANEENPYFYFRNEKPRRKLDF